MKTLFMDKKRQEQCLRVGRLNIYCIDQISLSDNLSQWNGYHGLCIGSFLGKNYTVFTKEVKFYVKFLPLDCSVKSTTSGSLKDNTVCNSVKVLSLKYHLFHKTKLWKNLRVPSVCFFGFFLPKV